MKLLSIALCGLTLAACASAQYRDPRSMITPASGQRAIQAKQSQIGVDQMLNDYVPMDLQFVDSDGTRVKLRDLLQGRPVILMPVFYECAGVCNLELTNMAAALHDFKKDSVGKEFDVVTFTIKPTETVEQAKARKATVLDIYNRRGAEPYWHFLTSDYATSRKLCDAIGFKYTYDEKDDAVVHPAAAIVLTPEGQISQYFLDTDYPRLELLDAIKSASRGRVGKKVADTSIWNCVNIDPLTGQRSLNILKVLNLAGIFTLVALAGSVIYMSVKYKVKAVQPENEDGGQKGA